MHGLVNDDTHVDEMQNQAILVNYQKANEASRKLLCFFRRKRDVLVNISVHYVIVLVHFVYQQNSKCTDKIPNIPANCKLRGFQP